MTKRLVFLHDSESSVPGLNLGSCSDLRTGNVIHEQVRDIGSALREGGIGVAVGES